MKLRNFFEIIGFKKKPQRFDYKLNEFKIPGFGQVKYAQWLHPYETEKTIDLRVLEAYKKFLKPGDFCIDIGAHTGDSTLPMAIAIEPSGIVLAIEPNPYVYTALEKTARANHRKLNIIPMMVAAGPQQQILELEYSDPGFCNGGKHEGISVFSHGHAYNILVQGVNLTNEINDDFAEYLPKLKFIKTDAEGFDLYILKSLETMIASHRPYIKSEIFKKTSLNYRKEMLAFFSKYNYTVHIIDSDFELWGEQLTEHNLTTRKHYDVFCVPNFDTPIV